MRVMIAIVFILAFAGSSMAQQNFRERQSSVERKFLIGPLPQTRARDGHSSIELLTQLTESLAPDPKYVFGLGVRYSPRSVASTAMPELPEFVDRWLGIPRADSQDWILDKAIPLQELTHPITARRPS